MSTTAPKKPRDAAGKFAKGQPAPPRGVHRKRGAINKITSDIKAGIISGFARHGSNGEGEGGFAGYCYFLARRHPRAAARLIEKLLPLTVNGSAVAKVGLINSVQIVTVPHDTFLNSDEIAKFQSATPVIEHEPIADDADDLSAIATIPELDPLGETDISPADSAAGLRLVQSLRRLDRE